MLFFIARQICGFYWDFCWNSVCYQIEVGWTSSLLKLFFVRSFMGGWPIWEGKRLSTAECCFVWIWLILSNDLYIINIWKIESSLKWKLLLQFSTLKHVWYESLRLCVIYIFKLYSSPSATMWGSSVGDLVHYWQQTL